MTHSAPVAARTVRPRKQSSKSYLPIITYTDECIYRERDDTYHDSAAIFPLTVIEKPSLIVAQGIAPLLRELHEQFHRDPLWQFACSPIEQQRILSNGRSSRVRRTDTMVTFLGFRGKPLPDGPRGGKRHEPNRYHTTLDPVTFVRRGINDLAGIDGPLCERLYIWATEVRRFCADNGLSLRPTAGSLSGQLLRDKRFYPRARRKVPAATNARAREHLPGNYYDLREDEGAEFDAYYLDQVASHHNCAKEIIFPHANGLKAHGHFRTLRNEPGVSKRALRGYGLFYVKLQVPHIPLSRFPPPWGTKPGAHTAYLFSNELPSAYKLGIQIEYVIAAWISNCRDRGLNRYAEWALEQLDGRERVWKKPLLLSTYGILAATPRIHKVGYANAIGGTPQLYPAGAGFIPVLEHATTKPSEPGYTNVIHRGMIEAETRQRSLQLARELFTAGHRVAAVYADSVFIHARNVDDENVPLPIPPPGWQVEEVLTRLRFFNPVSFTSDQMTKLPGVPARDEVLRASRGTQYFRKGPKTRATIVG